jgi:hypothetical protein
MKLEKLRQKSRESSGDQYWALYAASQARALKQGGAPQTPEKRAEAVTKTIQAILPKIHPRNTLSDYRVTLADVVELYEKDETMAEPVKLAREGIQKIDKIVNPGR